MALDPALPLFSFPAEWSQGISERLSFLTDALQARSGEEQARALRLAPRRSFEFGLALEGQARQLALARLWRTRASPWYLPILTDAVVLEADLASGSTTVAIAGADRDFSEGGVVMFRDPESADAEAFELAAYVPGSLSTLGAASSRTWPAGTLVFPARKARLDASFTAAAFSGTYGSGRVRFLLSEPSDWPAVAPPVTYRDFPVLTVRPHTERDPETEFSVSTELLDEGMGPAAHFDFIESPLPAQSHDFWLPDRAAISELRSWLYYLKGRQKSIWVPTWLDDLTIAESLGSSSTALRVRHCEFTAQLFEQNNRRDLRIELRSGAVYYRRVTAASEISATVEQLTLSSSLGVAIAPADVLQISFLQLCRSDSDLFQFEWWTSEFCEVTTSWRGRKHDQ